MTAAPTPPAPAPRAGRIGFAIAFAAVVVGLAYLGFAPQHWLRGVLVVAAGLGFAGLVRLGLPDRKAGPLMVRGRWFDGACYVLIGAAMVTFGILVR